MNNESLIIPASKRDRVEHGGEEPERAPRLTRQQRRTAERQIEKSKRNLNPPKMTAAKEAAVQDLPGLMEFVKQQQERLLGIIDPMISKLTPDIRLEATRVACAMSLAMWTGYLEAYVASDEERLDIVRTAREWKRMFVFHGAVKPEERKSNLIIAPAGSSGIIL